MENIEISYTARYVPPEVIDNQRLTEFMDTSDEWISQRTGIKKRHISLNESTADLAEKVAEKLLTKSGWNPNSLDLIIVATMSPNSFTPATAAIVQGRISADNAVCFDISAACSGYIYGLSIVEAMLRNMNLKRAMLIGSENLSKLIDWNDRSTAVLFGDGAAGALIELKEDTDSKFISSDLKTIGNEAEFLTAGITDPLEKFPDLDSIRKYTTFKMDGRRVYTFATREVPQSILRAVQKANFSLEDIDYFILHQANSRIIRQVAKKLKQDEEKFPINIDNFGNTSAASEPLLLDELIENGTVKRGMTLALSGFGGGLTVGTHIIKY